MPPKACPNGGRGCDCAVDAEGISIRLEFGLSEGPGEDLTETAAIVGQAAEELYKKRASKERGIVSEL